MSRSSLPLLFFFFIDTAPSEIYTLSLHDALPIWEAMSESERHAKGQQGMAAWHAWVEKYRDAVVAMGGPLGKTKRVRSEEHTSELQSHVNLVCRLLLEKKKKKQTQLQVKYSTSRV